MTYEEQIKSLMIEHKVGEMFAKMRNDMVWESIRDGDCTKEEGMEIIKDLNKEYSHQRKAFLAMSKLYSDITEESIPDFKENTEKMAENLMQIYGWQNDSE